MYALQVFKRDGRLHWTRLLLSTTVYHAYITQ
jgi:hypothetical protein